MQTNYDRANTTPARLSFPADFLPIETDDPLDYWRRRDLFHADVPSAEFTDAKKGVSVRAERRGGRFLLFVCGVHKRVIRDVHLRRRRDGRPYICPPFPSRWTSAAIQAIELLNNGQEVSA